MFMGEFYPTLDDKCRVAIPAKLRRAFGDDLVINKLIITKGPDKSLMAFREDDWREYVQEKLLSLPQNIPENRMKLRLIGGGAHECELDKQGRIVIPLPLKEYAEIDKDIVIIGLFNKIEIWSKDVFSKYRPEGEDLLNFTADLGL